MKTVKRNDNSQIREIPVHVPSKEADLEEQILNTVTRILDQHIRTKNLAFEASEITKNILKGPGHHATRSQITQEITAYYF